MHEQNIRRRALDLCASQIFCSVAVNLKAILPPWPLRTSECMVLVTSKNLPRICAVAISAALLFFGVRLGFQGPGSAPPLLVCTAFMLSLFGWATAMALLLRWDQSRVESARLGLVHHDESGDPLG